MKSKKIIILSAAAIAFAIGSCNNSSNQTEEHNESEEMHEHSHEQGEDSEQHHDSDSIHSHDGDSTHHELSEVIYQCPMHPEVTSDKPGTCPKCGMQLEKKTK